MAEVTLFAVVLVAALAVGAGVWSGVVPLSRRTVLAAAPWALAVGTIVVLGRAGAYDRVDLTTRTLLASVVGVGVGGWLFLAQLAALRNLPYRERYLGATGLGAVAVLLLALAVHVGNPDWIRVGWLVIAPVVAAMFAAVGYFGLGVVYTDAVVAFRLAGLYAVTTVVLDGVASAVAVEALGHDGVGVITTAIVAVAGPVGVEGSTWLLLPVHAVVGVAVVGFGGWLAQRRAPLGNGFVLVVSLLGFTSGTVVLLTATLLG